jgi:hypothetical protein
VEGAAIAAGIVWLRSASGDSEVPDAHWTAGWGLRFD